MPTASDGVLQAPFTCSILSKESRDLIERIEEAGAWDWNRGLLECGRKQTLVCRHADRIVRNKSRVGRQAEIFRKQEVVKPARRGGDVDAEMTRELNGERLKGPRATAAVEDAAIVWLELSRARLHAHTLDAAFILAPTEFAVKTRIAESRRIHRTLRRKERISAYRTGWKAARSKPSGSREGGKSGRVIWDGNGL